MSDKPRGRQPDFHLHAMHIDTNEKGRVGAAWLNDDGSITIKLDAFVTLTATPDLTIRLFKNDRKQTSDPANRSTTSQPARDGDLDERGIPF